MNRNKKTFLIIGGVVCVLGVFSFICGYRCLLNSNRTEIFRELDPEHTDVEKKAHIRFVMDIVNLDLGIIKYLSEFESTIGGFQNDGEIYGRFNLHNTEYENWCEISDVQKKWKTFPMEKAEGQLLDSHLNTFFNGEALSRLYDFPESLTSGGCYYFEKLSEHGGLSDIRVIIYDDSEDQLYLLESRY